MISSNGVIGSRNRLKICWELSRVGSSPTSSTLFNRNYKIKGIIMVKYDLSHLTQVQSQNVFGPIQDDEALLLYSIIKTSLFKYIVEIGALEGYSAKNFCKAIPNDGKVLSIDINPVNKIDDKHIVLTKDINNVNYDDIKNIGIPYIDLLFFDAHCLEEQMNFFEKVKNTDLITDKTIIAFHDTNLHYSLPCETCGQLHKDSTTEGYLPYKAHKVEREMVNRFKKIYGYDIICFTTGFEDHNHNIPFRHGITIAKKFNLLNNNVKIKNEK